MINKKISFIGGGNMAYAIAKGVVDNELLEKNYITIADISTKRLDEISDTLGVNTTTDNKVAIDSSDIIILAIKPQIFRQVSAELSALLSSKCVISIMAGISRDELETSLPNSNRILRTMPNMPALVGQGMTALCSNTDLDPEELDMARAIFTSVGQICMVDEHLIDAVIGISGSGPAYVFMFIEALADGGVLHGLSRELSYTLACQTVLGSAATVLESGLHPAVLKDRVASPAGTTIAAIQSLESDSFRSTIINAVDACVKKAKRL